MPTLRTKDLYKPFSLFFFFVLHVEYDRLPFNLFILLLMKLFGNRNEPNQKIPFSGIQMKLNIFIML